MYTYEIIDTINNNNDLLTRKQFVDIYINSPQIEELCVDPDTREFNHFAIRCNDKAELIKFIIMD